MPQVDPKLTFWFGVLTSILLGIATGAVHLPSTISPEMGTAITSWSSFLGWINNIILTALIGVSSTKAGPLISPPK